jgi:hypothetical protein
VVVHQPGTPPAFHALFHPDELRDRALLDAWLGRFGGLTLRLDGSGRALARLTGARAGPRVAVPARLAPALGPRPSVAARGALAPRPRASGLPQHRESPLHESSGARHAPRPGAARALRVQGARRRRARVHVRAQRSRRARSLLRTAARGDPRRPGGETPCSRLS